MAKEKTEIVRPTSQVDLETRLKNDNEVDAPIKTVNPNPLGEEAYVGTDPIYQNHANDTEKPLAAKSGADKLAEDSFKEGHDLGDVDKENLVDDSAFGGKAEATGTGGGPIVYVRDENGNLVPQEAGEESSNDEEDQTNEPSNPSDPDANKQ